MDAETCEWTRIGGTALAYAWMISTAANSVHIRSEMWIEEAHPLIIAGKFVKAIELGTLHVDRKNHEAASYALDVLDRLVIGGPTPQWRYGHDRLAQLAKATNSVSVWRAEAYSQIWTLVGKLQGLRGSRDLPGQRQVKSVPERFAKADAFRALVMIDKIEKAYKLAEHWWREKNGLSTQKATP